MPKKQNGKYKFTENLMFTYLTENQKVRDDRKDRELLVMGIDSTSGDAPSKGTQCINRSVNLFFSRSSVAAVLSIFLVGISTDQDKEKRRNEMKSNINRLSSMNLQPRTHFVSLR